MKLLIRADAHTSIGTGHVMRCLALAQAWRSAGGEVTFLSRLDAPAIEARLAAGGFVRFAATPSDGSVEDAEATIALATQLDARFIVADGYHFGELFQARVHAAGHKLLVIDDDVHAARYSAELILNQNLHAESLVYPGAATTAILRGPRFALLREEFWPWQKWTRTTPERPRCILVTLGGSDEDNVTLRVMRALAGLDAPGLRCRVLAGAANPHATELAALAQQNSGRFELVSASNQMPEEMAGADLAISAGGSTCWELAFMGLPSLVITLAPNQARIGPELAALGACVALGWHGALEEAALTQTIDQLARDPAQRRALSDRGRQIVDGGGAERVVATMLEFSR